jgi:predicted naringenin-chalcone synthase
MSVIIKAIGLATPTHALTQLASVNLAKTIAGDESSAPSLANLAARTGIQSRGSVLVRNDAGDQDLYLARSHASDRGPATSTRLEGATLAATSLGERACREALARAGVDASRVTHLVTASCTVLEAPGFDQGLMTSLTLSPDARRVNVGFMGCHAAINALAVAHAIAASDPAATVLVCCVELCSLHMHYTERTDRLIANALFADGAAACVVCDSPGNDASPTLARFGSRLFRGDDGRSTAHAMAWSIGDHGFEMTLDRHVPELLEGGVPTWIDSVLAREGLTRADVGGWAIHPGGPRIVSVLTEALALSPAAREQAERDSMNVLRSRGNMSSATVLFILDAMRLRSLPRPWVAMAFGPGLAGEAVVIR